MLLFVRKHSASGGILVSPENVRAFALLSLATQFPSVASGKFLGLLIDSGRLEAKKVLSVVMPATGEV